LTQSLPLPVPLSHALAAFVERRQLPASAGSAGRISEFAERALDAALLVDAFGFEVPLSADGIDLGMVFAAGSKSRGSLANHASENAATRHQPCNSPSWQRVLWCIDAWATRGTPEYRAATHAFLEFDTSSNPRAFEDPSLFLGVSTDVQCHAAARERVAADLVPKLTLGEVDDRILRTFLRCTGSLPAAALILHLGIMYSRGGHRLHVRMPHQSTIPYLDEIEWPGSGLVAEELLRHYATGDGFATLQLEIGGQIGSTIGLEFSPPGTLEGGGARWRDLLTRLTNDGLCTPEKRDALLGWPAVHRHPLAPGGWPCTISQDLSHVKVVLRPGQPLRAKAYLSVVPSFSLFAPA
jgi:hypothetical protein